MVDEGSGLGRRLGGPGFGVVDSVLASILRRKMLHGGETVVVAVSGGPDSTCLFDVLARLEDKLDLALAAAHVDHGLSAESEKVAARVAQNITALGYDVHVARARDLAGPNLHARAREFRYSFFSTLADKIGADKIATGHTLDDRVETTLGRLLHGAGTRGLAGLPAAEGSRIRPLIELRRRDTKAYCDEVGLNYHEDPANDDERFERARIRAHLVSVIEREWGDGAVKAVATSAERLSEDAAALRLLGERLSADLIQSDEEGATIKLDLLIALPRALRRCVLESAVGPVRDRSGGIDGALDALDDGSLVTPIRFSVAAGKQIVIERGRLLVRDVQQ